MDGDYLYEDDSWPQSSGSSSDLHVAATPIVMVSPPETSDDDDGGDEAPSSNNRASQQDVFQTPPEDSNPPASEGKTPVPEAEVSDDDRPFQDVGDGLGIIVAVGEDLGFHDVGAVKFRVSKRKLPQGEGSSESLEKKLKDPEVDLGISESRIKLLKGPEVELGLSESRIKLLKGPEVELVLSESRIKLLKGPEVELGLSEPQEVPPLNIGCSSGKSLEIDCGGDEKSADEGSEESETDVEETESKSEEEGSGEESIEEVAARVPNVSIEELRRLDRHWQRRALPPSIGGPTSADGAEEAVPKEAAILDVLKLLKDKYHGDGDNNDEVESCSFLEISRRRGMTFPGLSRWPECEI